MDQNIKLNKINSIFCYLISFAFLKGVSFILIPIYANYLTKNEYGYFIFLISILSFISLIADLGLNNALYKYIKNKKTDKLILGSVVSISFLMNIVLSISVIITMTHSNLFAHVVEIKDLLILCVSLLLSSFTMLNLTYLRVLNKSFDYMCLSISQPLIHLLIFGILIYIDSVNVQSILFSTLIANIITAIFVFLKNRGSFIFILKKSLVKKILKYTTGTMISVLALYVLTGFDKLFLSYYIKIEDLADYSLIMLFASISILIVEPISLWYFANRFKLLKDKQNFANITSNLILLNIWVSIFLIINTPFIYELLLPSIYNFNYLFFFLAVLSFHFKYLSTILNIGCYIKSTTNIVAKINLFAAGITLVFYLIFVNKFGTLSILISISFGYFLILALNMHYSNKEIELNYKKNRIFLNYIASIFIMIMFFLIKIPFIFQNIITVSIIIFINKKGLANVKYNIYKRKNKIFKKTTL